MTISQSVPHPDSSFLRTNEPIVQAASGPINPIVADAEQTAWFPVGSRNQARILPEPTRQEAPLLCSSTRKPSAT
jgi:hypothetical protein